MCVDDLIMRSLQTPFKNANVYDILYSSGKLNVHQLITLFVSGVEPSGNLKQTFVMLSFYFHILLLEQKRKKQYMC